MPAQELDLDPVDFLTIDAIGKPGQRVFYLQARGAEQTVTPSSPPSSPTASC